MRVATSTNVRGRLRFVGLACCLLVLAGCSYGDDNYDCSAQGLRDLKVAIVEVEKALPWVSDGSTNTADCWPVPEEAVATWTNHRSAETTRAALLSVGCLIEDGVMRCKLSGVRFRIDFDDSVVGIRVIKP